MSETYCDTLQRRSIPLDPVPIQWCYAEGKILYTVVQGAVAGLVIALGAGVLKAPSIFQKIAKSPEIFNKRWFVIGAQVGGTLGALRGIAQGVQLNMLKPEDIQDLATGQQIEVEYPSHPVDRWARDLPRVIACLLGCSVFQFGISLGFHALMKRIDFITGFWSFFAGSGNAGLATGSTAMLCVILWPPMGSGAPGRPRGNNEL